VDLDAITVLMRLAGKLSVGLTNSEFLGIFHQEFTANVPDFRSVSLAADSLLERLSILEIIQQESRRGRTAKQPVVDCWVLSTLGKRVVLELEQAGKKANGVTS